MLHTVANFFFNFSQSIQHRIESNMLTMLRSIFNLNKELFTSTTHSITVTGVNIMNKSVPR